jgi:hypothetical protein
VSQATITVAQVLKELQQQTKGAIEQSKDIAVSTVSELHQTHDMVRSDATALFERLRDANDLLQGVLGGARSNLNAIEQVLSTRVVEFVSTVERLLENTDSASGKLDRQVSSFYGLTSRVLGDLGEIAMQFEGHGKSLAEAVTTLERVNDDTHATVGGRKDAIEELAAAVDARTEQLDAHLKRFSNLIEVSLRTAEDRAHDAARIVSEATSEGARALAERHAAIRSTTEQESKQTLASLREFHQKISAEAKDLFQKNAGEAGQLLQQATDRFADVMQNMKKMSADMQRELETTRKELRRGVLELPEETAESMAQMRRVMVDQMEALAELNRIVARHGRAMDVGVAEPQPAARRGYGEAEPGVPIGMTLPEPPARTEPGAPRGRGSAPPPAGTTDWNSLQQRSRAEAPAEPAAPRPGRGRSEAPPATDWNSLQRGGRPDSSSDPPPRAAAAGAASRGRVEPPPPAAAPEWGAAPRARVEPSLPEPPPARPAPADRNGAGRGRIETPPEPPLSRPAAPGGQEAGNADDGGWLSNLLTRASREGDDEADERGAAVKGGRTAAANDVATGNGSLPGIESVDAMASQITRWINYEAAADLWERHNRGERGVNARRLYTPQGRKAFDEMRRRYNSDREFRQVVDRYIGQFDRFLGEVGHRDGGEAQARDYITSEAGQVYTMLSHAAGRFE